MVKKHVIFLCSIFIVMYCGSCAGVKWVQTVIGAEKTGNPGGIPDTGEISAVVYHQKGHTNDVTSAVFSPDGKYILSGSHDTTVKLWDAETGREIRQFTGHAGMVNAVAFSPDGKYFATGSDVIKLWDLETGLDINTFLENSVSLTFSPDGKHILSSPGRPETNFTLWNAQTGIETHILSGHTDGVSSVTFSPDGTKILSASWDTTLKVWDTETGSELAVLTGHTGEVTSAVFSPDGKTVLSGSQDGTIRLWNAETGDETASFAGYGPVAFSPDGNHIIACFDQLTLKLRDAATGEETKTMSGHTEVIRAATFSPDGMWIISCSGNMSSRTEDNALKLWDTETGREIRTFRGHAEAVSSAMYSPDGKRIISYGDNVFNLWDAETGRRMRSFSGHTAAVNTAAFSPDGKQLLTGSEDTTIKLWDLETGQEIKSFPAHIVLTEFWSFNDQVGSVAFSLDGKQFVFSGINANVINLLDIESGSVIRSFHGHTNPVQSAVFSPDGTALLSCQGDGIIKLWNIATGEETRTFSGQSRSFSTLVAFSPDGKYIISSHHFLSANDDILILWDAATGREIRTFSEHSDTIHSVSFSPDGNRFLSGSNNDIKLWDVATGQEISTFSEHSDTIHSVSFSPDGRHLLIGYGDGSIRILNAVNGNEILACIPFLGSEKRLIVNAHGITTEAANQDTDVSREWICITPDGYFIASPYGDRYINVRLGNDVTGVDSFRHVFYNPDVVEARLAGRTGPVFRRNFSIQNAADFFPSSITLTASPVTAAGDTTTLSVTIDDGKQSLHNIKIIVNGNLVGGDELRNAGRTRGLRAERARLAVTGNRKRISFTIPLALDPGKNHVEVVSFNGYAERRQHITITGEAAAEINPVLPKLWVLSVGVNQFDNAGISNQNYIANDARDIINMFIEIEDRRYLQINTLLAIFSGAPEFSAGIVRENLAFIDQAGSQDVILFFLAGQGMNGNGISQPSPGNTRRFRRRTQPNVITWNEIAETLEIPGKRFIFIDTRHSEGMNIDHMLRQLMHTNACVFLSSTGFTAGRFTGYSLNSHNFEMGN